MCDLSLQCIKILHFDKPRSLYGVVCSGHVNIRQHTAWYSTAYRRQALGGFHTSNRNCSQCNRSASPGSKSQFEVLLTQRICITLLCNGGVELVRSMHRWREQAI